MRPTFKEAQRQAAQGSTAKPAAQDAAPAEPRPPTDMAAFGLLVTRYQDRVLNFCLRMCGRPHDAEDLAQETFMRAFRAIESFDGRSRFYTWLYRIALNVCLSARRRPPRPPASSLDDPAAAGYRSAADASDPAHRAAQRETRQRVVRAIDELDQQHRAVILLRDMEGLDYAEIAQVLRLPVGTVKSRVHRARMALREKLLPLVRSGEDE